jgi:RNA ligase
MVLLGIRCNKTGQFLDTRKIDLPEGLEHPKQYFANSSEKEFIDQIRQWERAEGVVVSFPDGYFVKIKADDYVLKHKAVDGLKFEKDVLRMIVGGEIDDVLPILGDSVRVRVENYRTHVTECLMTTNRNLTQEFTEFVADSPTRKTFAERASKSKFRGILFKMFDFQDGAAELTEWVLANCNTQANCIKVRKMLDMTEVW